MRALVARRRLEQELDEELRFHLDQQVDAAVRRGADRREATRRAQLDFGGVEQVKEAYRDALGVRLVDDLRRDLRLAGRSLRATPGVTAAVVLSLGMAIGANIAIFSLLHGLLLRPLPVRDPDRLVHVTDSVLRETGETRIRAWSYPVWLEIRNRAGFFEASTAWSFARFDLADGGETRFVDAIWADGGFFDTLGVPPALGRTFSPLDDRPGGGPNGPVAVIAHGYWETAFGGAPDVVGRTLRLNGVTFTVVGVMPPEFFGVEVGRAFDVVVPLQVEPLMQGQESVLASAASNFLSLLARVRKDQSLDEAIAELRGLQPAIREATAGPWGADVLDRYLTSPFTLLRAATGSSDLRRTYDRALFVLGAIVAGILLIGCVNVANLLLARTAARRHEISVRLAIGASRLRLARQLFAESAALAAAGAALGLVTAAFSSRLLVSQLSTPARRVVLDVSIDGVVLAFAIALTALTALLFGTAPAMLAARAGTIGALGTRSRMPAAGTRTGPMRWLVVVQVGLSVAIVVAAGLFIRSFTRLASRPLGLQPDPVLVAFVDPQRTHGDREQRMAVYERLRDAVRALPDVGNAAISHLTPAGGGGFTPAIEIGGSDPAGSKVNLQLVPADGDVNGNLISSEWFPTFGMSLIAGRDFTDADRRGGPRVAIVNAAFARRFFGSADAVGRSITVYPNSPRAMRAEIVGIVTDAISSSPRERMPATWYMPMVQFDTHPFPAARLSIRTARGSAAALTTRVAEAVAAVEPRIALTFRPLRDQLDASLTRDRLMAELAGFLGLLALLLSGIGLYGVTEFATSQRRGEIAVRMALGATPARVIGVVLARLGALVGLGTSAGVIVSLWTAPLAGSLIHGLGPRDPATLAAGAGLLAVLAVVAGWLPARKAARTDPVAVLRQG
jgi:predicted permease